MSLARQIANGTGGVGGSNDDAFVLTGLEAPEFDSASTITFKAPDGLIINDGSLQLPSVAYADLPLAAVAVGTVLYDSTYNVIRCWNGSNWAVVSGEVQHIFTAPTTTPRTYACGIPLGSDSNVYLNGVRLLESSGGVTRDFNINGSSIVLEADAPTSTHVLEVINK